MSPTEVSIQDPILRKENKLKHPLGIILTKMFAELLCVPFLELFTLRALCSILKFVADK